MGASTGLAFVGALGNDLSSGQIELPSFPDAAERVRRTLADPDCCAARLSRVIGTDAVLAAQIIRMANSAAYNKSGDSITDLPLAVNRLGQDTIRTVSVAFAMRQLTSMDKTPELREPLGRIWKHSVQVAAIAHALALRCLSFNPDEAMLAGLVHDIGKLYILKHATTVAELANDGPAVEALVEGWHTGVGRAIVEAWDFSEEVAVAVDEHEELAREPTFPDLASLVLVANLYAKLEAKEIESINWDHVPSFRIIGLTQESGELALSDAAKQIRSTIVALTGR